MPFIAHSDYFVQNLKGTSKVYSKRFQILSTLVARPSKVELSRSSHISKLESRSQLTTCTHVNITQKSGYHENLGKKYRNPRNVENKNCNKHLHEIVLRINNIL